MNRSTRIAAWIVVGLVLTAVFMAYLRTDIALDLANQLWSCF
jgi:hypothetical protein